tara:strand:+ start:557 stop:811 length:255 start_codon:yes stop_codon:yes gene_type:complete
VSKETQKKQKEIRCVVVSDKMDKSRVAKIERRVKHPIVGKYIKKTTKLHFHDEANETKSGDEVYVVQTKPISKTKSFKFVSKVS